MGATASNICITANTPQIAKRHPNCGLSITVSLSFFFILFFHFPFLNARSQCPAATKDANHFLKFSIVGCQSEAWGFTSVFRSHSMRHSFYYVLCGERRFHIVYLLRCGKCRCVTFNTLFILKGYGWQRKGGSGIHTENFHQKW